MNRFLRVKITKLRNFQSGFCKLYRYDKSFPWGMPPGCKKGETEGRQFQGTNMLDSIFISINFVHGKH